VRGAFDDFLTGEGRNGGGGVWTMCGRKRGRGHGDRRMGREAQRGRQPTVDGVRQGIALGVQLGEREGGMWAAFGGRGPVGLGLA
jgi:hypothetical protein